MKPILCLLFSFGVLFSSIGVSAMLPQEDEMAWRKWSKKDAEKILTDSPWAQNQKVDMTEMMADPNAPAARVTKSRTQSNTTEPVNVKYEVRFFSARPVRRALVRLLELQNKPPADVVEKMLMFANTKASDSIIVTLTYQAEDPNSDRTIAAAVNTAVVATLKTDTYLERGGKRLFLQEYYPPGKDGFGARFIFQRKVDDKPFIADNTGEVRFVAQFANGPKINRSFKVAPMMYNGELEY